MRAPLRVRHVGARQDIVSDGSHPTDVSLIIEGFACRYKLLDDGRRQITALSIPGDICDLRALMLDQMDHAVAALSACLIAGPTRGNRAPLGQIACSEMGSVYGRSRSAPGETLLDCSRRQTCVVCRADELGVFEPSAVATTDLSRALALRDECWLWNVGAEH